MGVHLHELTPTQREELEEVVRYVQAKVAQDAARQSRLRRAAKATQGGGAHLVAQSRSPRASMSDVVLEAMALSQAGRQAAAATTASQSAPPLSGLTAEAFRAGRGAIDVTLPPLQPPLLLALDVATPCPARTLSPSPTSSHESSTRASPAPADADGCSSTGPLAMGTPLRADSTSADDDSDFADSDDNDNEQDGDDSVPVAPEPRMGRHSVSPCVSVRSRRPTKQNRPATDSSSALAASTPQSDAALPTPSSSSPSPCSSSSSSSASADTPSAVSDAALAVSPRHEWSAHLARGTLLPGYDPKHNPMHLNLAPVQWLHRPLAIYAGVLGLGCAAATYMRLLGFQRHSAGRLNYYYRRAERTPQELAARTPASDPLILIHGIGIGPFTYLHLLRPLIQTRNAGACAQRSVFVLELPSISMRVDSDDVPSPLEHVQAVADMLYRHEMEEREDVARAQERVRCGGGAACAPDATSDSMPSPAASSSRRLTLEEVQQSSTPIKALIVGHSYGTFVATWLIKHRPDLFAAVVFIDPVCFMVSVERAHTRHVQAETRGRAASVFAPIFSHFLVLFCSLSSLLLPVAVTIRR